MTDLIHRLGDLLAPLAHVDPRWALLALALQVGNLVLRSFAWRNVLVAAFPTQRIGAYKVGRAYAVGVALNGYLPARAGDAAKVALVRSQHPDTNAVTIASSCSVVVLFDSLVGIALLLVALATGALPALPALPLVGTVADSPWMTLAIAGLLLATAVPLLRRLAPRLRSAWLHARQGVAVLGSPVRYLRTVVAVQSLAWACRIGIVYCMLAAFGIDASLPLAAIVMVVGGMSTMVPVPGGAGAQQALAVFVLAGVATAGTALSYSIGMQVGVTVVNTLIGTIAAMLIFGRIHPLRALRDAAAMATVRPAADPIG